jgi:type I restriction enzyme, S subunit
MRVPEGWSIKAISDVGNVITGSTPSTTHPEYYGGEIPFISPADLGVRKFISTSTKTLTNAGFNCTRKIRKGATLFTCIGSTIGKIGLSNVNLATNQQINAVVPHDNYDDEYVYYALSNRAIQIAKIAGNQAVPIINKSTFAAQLLLTPPLPEQQKIAQILSTWDKAISTTEQLLANSQQQKKALMQQLLTGKKRLLDEGGVRFSGEWNHSTIGKIGLVKSAGVDKKVVEGEVPVRLLNFTDVFNNSFIYSQDLNHWVTAPPSKIRDCDVRKGDVFFTPSSETREEAGIPAVAAEDISECCYSYHVVRYRINEPWDLNFKAYAFTTPQFRKQVNRLADGSGQRYVVSQDSFRSILIRYPDIAEQKKIGGVLKLAENEVDLLQTKLEALKQEKKALMQQLLTGKRRVIINH